MQQTEHYQLNQWDPADRILRTDFNADNAKIDTALSSLDTSLAKLSAAVGKKMGRAELIRTFETTSMFTSPVDLWEDWDLIFMIHSYPNHPDKRGPLQFAISARNGGYYSPDEFSNPGFLMVLMPWHNATRLAQGFLLTDHFLPFTCSFPFQDITMFTASDHQAKILSRIDFFGMR